MSTELNQIGKYGTLSFMKVGGVVVTAFGVDRDELTFGTDKSCDVRLLYPDIEPIHCKITFSEDHKAFLVVIGSSGVCLDGETIVPDLGSSSGNITVPVANNSEIEIHHKRFRFSYPPKEMRPVLYNSPAPNARRKLRLSLVESAQVFSPKPSPHPQENLHILRSPMRRSPTKSYLSQVTTPSFEEDNDENEDQVILVEGHTPRVVQEESDLVIVEEVDHLPPPLISPSKSRIVFPFSPSKQQVAQTPPRRTGRPSLHRHVLLKSAQRAVLLQEEEEEMEEVLGAVTTNLSSESESDGSSTTSGDRSLEDDEDVRMLVDDDSGDTIKGEHERERENGQASQQSRGTWRQSLGMIWPFSRASAEPTAPFVDNAATNTDEAMNEDETETTQIANDEEESDELASLPSRTQRAPPLRRDFMTPQFPRAQSSGTGGRLSLGTNPQGPRRIFAQAPQNWKVGDIVVPEKRDQPLPLQSPIRKRESISKEERKAISQRRRSALMEQDDYFGPAGIPGMSPVRRRPGSVSPTKPSVIDIKEENDDESNAIVPDSRAILAKMKETMAGVKRRESLQPSTPLLERSRKISSMDMDVDVREDRETSEASSSSNHTNPFLDTAPVTATPSFQGMRELFNTSKVPTGMNTPAMKSMRSLFRPEPQNNRTGLHSPMMERAGEFLQCEDVKDEVPKAETRNAGKKSRVLRATATDTPSLADDEALPVVGEHIPDNEEENEEETAQKKGRILRARPASNKPPSTSLAPSRPTRGRSKTPQPTTSTQDESVAATTRRGKKKFEPDLAPRSTRSKKLDPSGKLASSSKKTTVSPTVDEDEDELDVIDISPIEPVKTTRTSRKAKPKDEIIVPDEQPAPARTTKGRKKIEGGEKENGESEGVKVRVSRTRKVKEEVQSEPEVPKAQTRTRVTRSRAVKT